jgi:hypothetical protein
MSFRWALVVVAVVTVVGLVLTQVIPYLPSPSNTDEGRQAFDAANWGFRSGFGAFLGMLAGRTSRLK